MRPPKHCEARNHLPTTSNALAGEVEELRRWLFDRAFPLWWEVGADRSAGGYYERIDFNGRPAHLPRRSRVAARMAFCYCEAGQLGWQGPWREAAQHALTFLRERFVKRDGTVIASLREDGSVDATFDLYDQAFALFAYRYGHAIDPTGDWRSLALRLVDTLEANFAHPLGGFREDRAGALPLRANPHMHLLEAALSWRAADDASLWRRIADEIVALSLEHFVEAKSGALREYFSANWRPLAGERGEIVEPGHHYEWAYLLDRWAMLSGQARPAAVAKLIAFADANGIDRTRRVAVNGVRLSGEIADAAARLWPQTERLRAYVIDRQAQGDEQLHQAIASLQRYLAAPRPGLWYENLAADGQFVIEAAPATSLYHIVGAVAELCGAFAAERQANATGLR